MSATEWLCLYRLHTTVCRDCGRCKCYVHKHHRFDPVPKPAASVSERASSASFAEARKPNPSSGVAGDD